MKYKSFEDMAVWEKAMKLAQNVFGLTAKLPRKEDYGLTSQINRAALSVYGNIAEGFGRKHTKNKLNFYYNSRGSLAEAKNHLIYGLKVANFNKEEFAGINSLIDEIWKELNKLIGSFKEK
jgi:four helix bundle protein